MKKSLNLFSRKKTRRRQREDDFIDYDELYDEGYDEEYDDEDYPDKEFDEEYGDEVDDRYEDEDYPEEDEYPEDDDYEDYDRDYQEDDDYDGGYEDEDYDLDYEDDYDEDRGAYDDYGRRSDRGGRRGRDRDPGESVGARILEFLGNTSVAERAAVIVAVLLLAGGVAFMAFYSKAKDHAAEVDSFADVGADLQIDGVVGSTGLLAIADAEMTRAMAAGMVEEIEEEQEEEEEVPDTASNVTIKMTLTSIKSDMKIKFINSETKKLVANVPFVVSVVTPDGTKISYDDHDRDGIIYKKDLTAGKYTITPEALSSEYDSYKLDTSAQTLTVKDTVEMKAVDVSNEIKKESQVNAAKEDTAVQTQVESVLTDTVEWIDSNQNSSTSSDGKYKYEEIDKNDIPNPTNSAKLTVGSVRRMAAARSRARTSGDNANNLSSTEASAESSSEASSESSSEAGSEGSTQASTGGTTEASTGGTTEASTGGTTEAGTGGTTEASTGGTTEAGTGGTTDAGTVAPIVVPEPPKDMSVSLTQPTIKRGQSTTINVSGPSGFNSSSDNAAVATASGNIVTAVGVGTANITVNADGYNSKTVTVTVIEADKLNMTLSSTNLTIKIGETGKITASGPGSFTVRSSNESIAKVAADGTITPVAEGTASIIFSAPDYNDATAAVTVVKAEAKIFEMNVKSVTLVQGQTFNIGPKDTTLPVTYTSDNTEIATISGVTITGVKEGKTAITCSCAGYADIKIEVTVVSNTTVLKDKNGNVVYVKDANGNYVEATYNDYYNGKTFYLKKENDGLRQGWWTIDGKTYYFNKNGEMVTGEQVIKGAKYTFGSDGALSSSSGSMGIDVSKWNGNINWTQVKNAGVNYAIIRCGYRGSSAGALIEDPKFKANIQGAQAAGIKVGVYFFSQAINEVEAVEEASMCINLCKGYNLSFPVYIDIEASNGRGDQISASQRTANVKAFCGTIQSAGYRAGVYSNKTWFTQHMNASSLTSYKIWLAQYAANVTYSATRYDMWQYTSKGSISGISGNVDMNINYN